MLLMVLTFARNLAAEESKCQNRTTRRWPCRPNQKTLSECILASMFK